MVTVAMREEKKLGSGLLQAYYIGMTSGLRRQILTFAVIGVVATAVQYLLLVTLVESFGINPVLGSIIGFTVSALLSYRLNHFLTFGGTALHSTALPRFLIVAAIGLGLNTSVMVFFYTIIGVHYLISQVAATVIVFLWSFTGNRLWSFR